MKEYAKHIKSIHVHGQRVPDAATLKKLVDAFQTLVGCRAVEIYCEGDWYGPIDGNEFPGFTLHSGYSRFRVVHIGHKYITIRGGYDELWEHKVLPTENRRRWDKWDNPGAKSFEFVAIE